MTCTNCGRPVTGEAPVTENGFVFCSNICRIDWRKKGMPSPFRAAHPAAANPTVDALEFPIEPPGFENRGMRIRLSYWRGPRIMLDGRPLEPVKGGFLGRKREYRAISRFGKEVTIGLRLRPLDQVPLIEIDGQAYPIARPLTSWEYIWMSLPALLLFVGGALGAVIGLAAVFSNSILLRRVAHPVPRYLLTGATTAVAFMFFWQSTTLITPFLESIGIGGMSADAQLRAAVLELNKNCPVTIDDQTRFDSASSSPGKVLIYHFTLISLTVDRLDIENLKQSVRPGILSNIRKQEGMRPLRELGVTFIYRYTDRNGRPAFELSVPPEEYRE